MAKTFMITGTGAPVSIGRNLTRFFVCANAPLVAESTEAYTQIRHRVAGDFSNLSVVITSNTKDEDATLRLRNSAGSGGNGNLVIVIPGGTTGTFTDAVNTDSVAGYTEEINYSLLSPDEENERKTIKISIISIVFSATTDTVVRHAAVNFPDLSDGTTTFYSLCGEAETDYPTYEGCVRFDTNAPALYKSMFVYVSQNLGTSATVVNLRANGGNCGVPSSVTVSLTALTTGIFEDLVNGYFSSAGDDLNYDVVSQNLLAVVLEIISVLASSTDKTFHSVFSTSSQLHGTTGFIPLGGGTASAGIEEQVRVPIGVAAAVSNLTFFVSSNTIVT